MLTSTHTVNIHCALVSGAVGDGDHPPWTPAVPCPLSWVAPSSSGGCGDFTVGGPVSPIGRPQATCLVCSPQGFTCQGPLRTQRLCSSVSAVSPDWKDAGAKQPQWRTTSGLRGLSGGGGGGLSKLDPVPAPHLAQGAPFLFSSEVSVSPATPKRLQ